ncbi:CDP-diacylglycerol--serine O-phosphatidyltransferase [Alkalilacustris brevis]|uniref:CDP-diacylglycerol--serine O-phosphatidyltransferase n=1 Tax=Alkalilacustris brevis TaxID=2026338 RepID=UPI000E0D25F2|nr:CDP-diacylglycerol--serine O-phosphatidyltransferase [Alkalilacustris brevis]
MARKSPFRRDRRKLPVHLLIPNLVTILGLCAGLTAIRFTFDDRFELAAALIIFAAVIDGLDGLIARRLKATSNFGAELDSFSDFVCFGVAPGILAYRFAMGDVQGAGWVFVLVFIICCCLRLARFNLNRDRPLPDGIRPHFVGVPAPAGAMLAMLPLFISFSGLIDTQRLGLPVALYVGFVGLMMVSRMPTISPKALRIRRDQTRWVLVGMAIVAGLVLTQVWLLMMFAVLVYLATLVHGAVQMLLRRRSHKGLAAQEEPGTASKEQNGE